MLFWSWVKLVYVYVYLCCKLQVCSGAPVTHKSCAKISRRQRPVGGCGWQWTTVPHPISCLHVWPWIIPARNIQKLWKEWVERRFKGMGDYNSMVSSPKWVLTWSIFSLFCFSWNLKVTYEIWNSSLINRMYWKTQVVKESPPYSW